MSWKDEDIAEQAWTNDDIAPVPSPQPLGPRDNTFLAEARRQLGLTARTAANAGASLLTVPGDALAKGMNAMVGSDANGKPVFGLPSEQVNSFLTYLGAPEAERPIERFTQDVAKVAVPSMALPAKFIPQVIGNAAIGSASAPQGQEGSGAAWGAGGGVAGHALGKAVKALTPTAEADKLLAQGVPLTYGQRLGPPVQSLENTLARVPYVGAPIRQRQQEALEGWQQATRNVSAPEAKTVDEVATRLGKEYERLLSAEPFKEPIKIDRNAIGYHILEEVPGITGDMLTRIDREATQLLSAADSPRLYHQAVSVLKGLAHDYKSSPDATQRLYGKGLSAAADKVSEAYRSGLDQPVREALSKVDAAWAQYVPIRGASTKYVQTLDSPENYTPRMLLQALRQRDSSLGKSQFRGTPQGQLAVAGEQAIGSRSNAASTGSGIGSLILSGGAAALGHTPEAILASTLGAAYGTKAGQQFLIGTLPYQQATINALRRGATPATLSATRKPQNDE